MDSHVRLPQKLLPWAEARRRHSLSDAHVQMARELGLNPKGLGKIDNHRQKPWKAPLPDFIARLYFQRFGRERPVEVFSLEQVAARQQAKKAERRATKLAAKSHLDRDGLPDPAMPSSPEDAAEQSRPETDASDGPPWF
jgi:hypothetical protein